MIMDLQDLSGVDTVLLDSRQALDFARSRKLAPSAQIYGFSPALAQEPDVKLLEFGFDSAGIRKLSDCIAAMGAELHDELSKHVPWRRYALTVARVTTGFELLAYKASFSKHFEHAKSIALVEPKLKQRWMVSPWREVLKNDDRFSGILWMPVELSGETEDENASIWDRLRFEGHESIGYRLANKIGRSIGRPLSSATILIPRQNSIIKEAAFNLFLRGATLVELQAPQLKPDELAEGDIEWFHKVTGKIIHKCLSSFLELRVVESLLEAFLLRVAAAVGLNRAASKHWSESLSRLRLSGRVAVLTNYNVDPVGQALFNLCKEKNIPHFATQHGTGFELSTSADNSPFLSEIATCDYYFAYNSAGRALLEANPYRRGTPIEVGLPRDLAQVRRRSTRLKFSAPIVYVSNQALIGNVMRPSSGGLSDIGGVRWESDIIENVLTKLPHRVTFKPYRSRRYLDQNPIVEMARQQPNIDVVEHRIDLRYMVTSARVNITSYAASTLSWCVLSGKPTVYFHSNELSPLRGGFLDALTEGIFVFDCDDEAFFEKATLFLSQPIDLIERAWQLKEEARRSLIPSYFGNDDGRAGQRIARHIRDVLARGVN